MKKLTYSIIVSILCSMQGCTLYHAPWDTSFDKKPTYKEATVYQMPSSTEKASYQSNAPKLNAKTNLNKNYSKNVSTKVVKTESLSNSQSTPVFKEKKVVVSKLSSNDTPKIASVQETKALPEMKNGVIVIPIE